MKREEKIKSNYFYAKKKTGKLFSFCLQSVAIVGEKKSKEKLLLGNIGEDIGLLFQLKDDFLDVKGSKKLVGKPIQKDKKKVNQL